MSKMFGLEWKDHDNVRMRNFITILNAQNKKIDLDSRKHG